MDVKRAVTPINYDEIRNLRVRIFSMLSGGLIAGRREARGRLGVRI